MSDDPPKPYEPRIRKPGNKNSEWKGHRRGVASTPGTSKRSAKRIRITQRQQQVLQARLAGWSYPRIATAVKVSKSQVERDITAAMADMIREPAEQVFKLEMERLDAMTTAHFVAACQGDIGHTHALLRIMEHRAHLMGWGKSDNMAAKLTISDGADRKLEVEFVLPGGTRHALDASPSPQQPVQSVQMSQQPVQRARIEPSPSDVVVERVLPSAWEKPHGSYGWLK
jgi:hypothetical protein